MEEARCEFKLAYDGATEVAGLHKLGRLERHAGTDDNQVLTAEGEQAVAAGLNVDALFKQGGDVFRQGFGAADVRDGDLGALVAQKQSRRQTGFAQSDNQNLLAFEFHHWISSVSFSRLLYCAPCR